MELFPSVPEDLEAVSTDELQGILDEFARIGADLRADIERPKEERTLIPAEATASEVTEMLQAAVADRKRVEEALATRSEAEAAFLEELDEGLAALGVDTGEAAAEEELAAESEENEGNGEGEGEAVAVTAEAEASGELAAEGGEEEAAAEVEEESTPARRLAIPSGPSRYEPTVGDGGSASRVLATHGLGAIQVREGSPLDRDSYSRAVVALAGRLGPVRHVRGGSPDRFSIGKVEFAFPDEMTLNERDPAGNLEKIRAVSAAFLGNPRDLEVFVASGGICAPPTPFYEVPGYAVMDRPVRGALPSFQATRGGISVPSVNIVDRSDSGVTIIEESDDEAGGSLATKACRTVDCATWTDTFIGAISHCLQVGNLNARTWPEGVALENDNLMAGWAATAEMRLLNRIKALSVKSNTSHVYNAVHDVIYGIVRVKASVRSVLRAARDAQFTALIPEWIPELMVADLAAQSRDADRYVAMAAIDAYLTRLGVTPVYYKDTPSTGVSQVFAAQADAGLATADTDDFPLVAQVGLFLNGTFLHLDGGSLELGLVRDSTLNETNDHELFGESFENVARIGPEQAARWLTMAICPTGQFPDLATALACPLDEG